MENYSPVLTHASVEERTDFYKKTYTHVALAVLAFIGFEALLYNLVPVETIQLMFSGKFTWLFILGLFWLGSFMADRFAFSADRNTQYLGLGLYVILQAVIFLPMIYMAMLYSGFEMINQAAIITLAMFGGLTAVVFMTNADFSFLRTAIVVGGFIALGLIVAGAIFGFNLGLWFSVGMVVLASASILYQTTQIRDQFNTTQYVGAALQIFASLMILFWYILRIFMSRD
ncbi:MAG TPA: Bax inhibitor-1 family protein [Saprospiraceae bacterium]|nr:Bax inhibitor-1 family protein [Saprospiraceae bacterium]